MRVPGPTPAASPASGTGRSNRSGELRRGPPPPSATSTSTPQAPTHLGSSHPPPPSSDPPRLLLSGFTGPQARGAAAGPGPGPGPPQAASPRAAPGRSRTTEKRVRSARAPPAIESDTRGVERLHP